MPSDLDQYKQLFIEEAKEHIDVLTKSLLVLEKDATNKDVMNMLFRSAHTLKGSSAMMGFKDLSELTHAMEDVFDKMRRGAEVTTSIVSILLECVDALTSRLDNIQNNLDKPLGIEPFVNRLRDAPEAVHGTSSQTNTNVDKNSPTTTEMKLEEKEKAELGEAAKNGERCFLVNIKISDDCQFKAIRATMVMDKLAEDCRLIKVVPSNIEISEEKFKSLDIILTSKCEEKEIEKYARSICEIESVRIKPIDSNSMKHETVKTTPQVAGAEKAVIDAKSAQSVRVRFDQLDKLMNCVGELVINKIALLQITDDTKNDGLKSISENIDRLTADLQDLVTRVRMVPIGQIFDRFPRLVRDLSLKKGKEANLIMNGREIEVDRTVLDEIGEPLIHLLRNSVDHGIETPDERKRCGKDQAGRIVLSARRKGDHVFVEVEDDGQGIDPEKVKRAAIERGFISEIEAEKMNEDQLINLIFLPGLSTAKEVTETSGRGVGMDVVRTKISSLGGTVHLETHVSTGTKVTIKLPLTLAIIRAILVRDSGQSFAIPISQVSETVCVDRDNVKLLGSFEAVNVRDHVIPLLHLHNLLNLKGSKEAEKLELLITYMGNEEKKLGLVVDSVERQQEILIKSLHEDISKTRGISGATILGDGQVVLVLDVPMLIERKNG